MEERHLVEKDTRAFSCFNEFAIEPFRKDGVVVTEKEQVKTAAGGRPLLVFEQEIEKNAADPG